MIKEWLLQRSHRRNQHRNPRIRWIDLGATTALVVVILLGVTVARAEGGRVLAWGLNNSGQRPVPAEALRGVSRIAAGTHHILAVKDGRVLAWGSNSFGETTVPEEALTGVTQIAGGRLFSMALKNGRVLVWGANDNGQCDLPPEALSGVTRISAGGSHCLALKKGRVLAWGMNAWGQVDVPEEALSGVTEIAATSNASLAVKNGRVLAWGQNPNGESDVPAEALSGVARMRNRRGPADPGEASAGVHSGRNAGDSATLSGVPHFVRVLTSGSIRDSGCGFRIDLMGRPFGQHAFALRRSHFPWLCLYCVRANPTRRCGAMQQREGLCAIVHREFRPASHGSRWSHKSQAVPSRPAPPTSGSRPIRRIGPLSPRAVPPRHRSTPLNDIAHPSTWRLWDHGKNGRLPA